MERKFVIGLAGSLFGLVTAGFIIFSSTGRDMTLSGVQAALFFSLAMAGAAISTKEPGFGGWMLILSAVFVVFSVPVTKTLSQLFMYLPAVVLLGISGILCFLAAKKGQGAERKQNKDL
jgi:hypothetical protein